MQRRSLLRSSLETLAAMVAVAATSPALAQAKKDDHSHHSHGAAAPAGATPARKFDDVIAPLQTCTAAVSACIAHCQVLLARGDKSLGRCLRTALDCDVVCPAALRAAGLNSVYTAALLRTAVAAMEACIKACKPHVEHHAECKACHDSCIAAVDAARKLLA
jgi:Cys-rich four helix bundle protein (predicted Tat secretion target)